MGKIETSNVSNVRAEYTESQSTLFQYAENDDRFTNIGVFRRVNGGAEHVVDEWKPELGPPTELLDDFLDVKYSSHGSHEVAWEQVDFEERYRDYLDSDSDAREALSELVERVEDGEDVCLVCYEGTDESCHRRILSDVMDDMLHDV